MTDRLYGLSDMARVLGIAPNALANRRDRNGPVAYRLPEPAYHYGRREAPLWTREQVEAVIADRQAIALATLDTP